MDNFDELTERLSKAARRLSRGAPKLDAGLLEKVSREPAKLSFAERLQASGVNLRRLVGGGAITAGAAVLAVALVVNTASQPLIQLAGNQGQRNNESASAAMDGGADKMWHSFQTFEYRAGANLSNQRGSGTVYKLVRQQDPESVLLNVAKVMGVTGQIKKYPDFNEAFPGYFYSESADEWGYDAVNPVISLWWSGTASWNYSNPIAYPQSECEESDSDGNCSRWTEMKASPELLPSNEVAIAKALEIFNATGLAATESDLKLYRDDWGVNIGASLKVDGQDTNIEWYVGWSSTGVLSYAGGHSVVAEAVGSFETISEVEAVERLSDWRWSGSPASSYYEKFQPRILGYEEGAKEGATAESNPSLVEEPETAPDTPVSDDGGSEPGSPGSSEPSEPVIIDEPMDPELVILEVVEAEATLLSIWDANNDVWLVPGYIMINDQGWFNAVISLIDGVIELPKETEYEILPEPAVDSPVSN
jgi:hypothetical protein